MTLADIPWDKIITGALAALGMWCAPRLYRAARNIGKTEVQLADEALDRALAAAEKAHANSDPGDDAAADALVARAREARARALRMQAIADSLGGQE